MTPDQFKQIRIAKGLSCKKMAEFLGLKDRRTIQRYESGALQVPRFVVIILELTQIQRYKMITDKEIEAAIGAFFKHKNVKFAKDGEINGINNMRDVFKSALEAAAEVRKALEE